MAAIHEKPSATLFVSVATACLGAVVFGYTLGFTSPTKDTMLGKDGGNLPMMTEGQASWFSSLVTVGAAAGAFLGGMLSEWLGRRSAIAIAALPLIGGFLMTAFLKSSLLLSLSRVICGLGVGVCSAVVPCYIGEVSTTGLRGTLGACNQLSITVGIFVVNLLGAMVFTVKVPGNDVPYCQWEHLALVGAIASGALFLNWGIPESPVWLGRKGKSAEMRAALKRLRNADSIFDAETLISADESTAEAVPLREAFAKYRPCFVIGFGLQIFQQFGGCNAVIFYAGSIFSEAGMKSANSAAMVVMLMQVVFTFASCLLMDRAGRKPLLIASSATMGISSLGLAYFYLSKDVDWLHGPVWLPVVCACTYIIAFSLGMGPIPWLVMAEIFPDEVRGKAASIATGINWAGAFVITLTYDPISSAITPQGTFLVFALICFCCSGFVAALMPETKGRTIDEIQAVMSPARTITRRHSAPPF